MRKGYSRIEQISLKRYNEKYLPSGKAVMRYYRTGIYPERILGRSDLTGQRKPKVLVKAKGFGSVWSQAWEAREKNQSKDREEQEYPR